MTDGTSPAPAQLGASIVVPSRGGRSRLPILFGALTAETTSDFEVIVVVDGDIDDSTGLVESWADRLNVRAITFPENRGRSEALNAGFNDARGRVLIRCDDDLEPGLDFVANHIAHHAGEPVGIIGVCHDVFAGDSRYAQVYGKPADERLRASWVELPSDQTWRTWSANVSVTRETYDRVGGYDSAQFRRYGWEDVDWGYRLHLLGAPVAIALDVDALHHNPSRSTRDRAARAFLSGASRGAFEAKHGPVLGAPPSPGRGPWGWAVWLASRPMRSEAAVERMGSSVDAMIGRVPFWVAAKLVALVVEAAGYASSRHLGTAR